MAPWKTAAWAGRHDEASGIDASARREALGLPTSPTREISRGRNEHVSANGIDSQILPAPCSRSGCGRLFLPQRPTRRGARRGAGVGRGRGAWPDVGAEASGTNRVTLDTGWTALKGTIGYKPANVIVVPAMHISRKCHECGAVRAASRRTRDGFACMASCASRIGNEPRGGCGQFGRGFLWENRLLPLDACGHAVHADFNAARNIWDRTFRRIAPINEASGTGAPARRAALALATSTDP